MATVNGSSTGSGWHTAAMGSALCYPHLELLWMLLPRGVLMMLPGGVLSATAKRCHGKALLVVTKHP